MKLYPPLKCDPFQEIKDEYKKVKKIKSNKMKKYKVIFTGGIKGEEIEVAIIVNADIFELVRKEGLRYYNFFDSDANLKAAFKAEKVMAIYEV